MKSVRSTGFSKKFTSACSVSRDSFSAVFTLPASPADSCAGSASGTSEDEPCARCPASPICSTKLVTVAMAWKRSFSSGNWMNSRCVRRK
uniref:Uncharacterized protein n=1 Tax=Labrus bergylta TaxID=56723 RepID=A0A3Q3FLE2_9LABR